MTLNRYLAFALAIFFLLQIAASKRVQAYSISSTSAVGGNLSSPITNFINSARQINLSLPPKTGFNLGSFSPTSVLNQINDWFYRETGFRFSDIFKKVGALLVWLLTAVADGIRWLLAWL